MSSDIDVVLVLLRSIDVTLKELLVLSKSKRAETPAASNVASDADLDSEYGDELVRAKMPQDWTGEDFKGARMSECPAELLEMLAERHAYFAGRNREDGDMKKAGYELRSERRARGWAARKRSGWTPKPAPTQEAPW
jgi:hypothetical protein